MMNVPDKKLQNIAQGLINRTDMPVKLIIEGKKMANEALRVLAKDIAENPNYSVKEALDFILTLDEAVEKNILNEDLLQAIKDDPNLLTKVA